MADSRVSATVVRQILDNLAKIQQTLQAAIDGGFSGESTTTFLYGLRYLVETRLHALADGKDKAAILPAADALLKQFDGVLSRSPGTVALFAPLVKQVVGAVCATMGPGHYPGDVEYAGFWPWWAANHAVSPNDMLLGETADCMKAAGIAVDPTHCVPPEKLILAHLLFSGSSSGVSAAVTRFNDVDPLTYSGPFTSELCCIARAGSPATIAASLNKVRIETQSPLDTALTTFALAIPDSIAAGQCVDITPTASHLICGVTTGTDTDGALSGISGAKAGDEFYIRVKQYRAASF